MSICQLENMCPELLGVILRFLPKHMLLIVRFVKKSWRSYAKIDKFEERQMKNKFLHGIILYDSSTLVRFALYLRYPYYYDTFIHCLVNNISIEMFQILMNCGNIRFTFEFVLDTIYYNRPDVLKIIQPYLKKSYKDKNCSYSESNAILMRAALSTWNKQDRFAMIKFLCEDGYHFNQHMFFFAIEQHNEDYITDEVFNWIDKRCESDSLLPGWRS